MATPNQNTQNQTPAILNDEPKFQAICKTVFNEFDKDKSGHIDIKELEAALQKMAKSNSLPVPSKQDIQDALKLYDKNKDGKIELKEFTEVTRESYRKAVKNPAKDDGKPRDKVILEERVYLTYISGVFSAIDKENKGFIITADLTKCLNEFATQSKLPPPSKADIQKIFDKYDANKDRKIDYKEFSRMAGEVFNIEIERNEPQSPEENKDHEEDEVEEEIDEATKQRIVKSEEYQRYIEETGLAMAFKIIFAEILSKKISEDAAFAYAATRLRQIGDDIAYIQNSKYKKVQQSFK